MKHKDIFIKVGVSVFALTLLALHVRSLVALDTTALGLASLAILPWLSSIIKSATLPGGWELTFAEVKDEQAKQRKEIDLLRFLMENFVTGWEFAHLRTLDAGKPFAFTAHEPFRAELRRLLNFGLLEEVSERSLEDAFYKSSDLRDVVRITDRGREYLDKRQSLR